MVYKSGSQVAESKAREVVTEKSVMMEEASDVVWWRVAKPIGS